MFNPVDKNSDVEYGIMPSSNQKDTLNSSGKSLNCSEVEIKTPILDMDTNERQRRYVESQKSKGRGLGVVFQDAFIRGMRDIGYKSPAWAIAELIDNAIQASARAVEVRLQLDSNNKSRAKPDQIAIIDNGAGMIPEMISYAVRWGGTDREGDRHGFGRYGYGLPSACVSIAALYTVYSKVAGGDWHAVTIDLEQLSAIGTDTAKADSLLQPTRRALPAWLTSSMEGGLNLSELESGTVIVLEDLDRLRKENGWILAKSLKAKLLESFGIIYRHWFNDIAIIVDETKCEPIDPLFLMPHARHYAETSVMAKAIKTTAFEVINERGNSGTVRIRAAVLPPLFSWATPDELTTDTKKNKRFDIFAKEEFNGILICREGRQIDVVSPKWTKFQNWDRYIKIEIDFDPELDEYFGVTTSKQQITINDVMWEKLKSQGREAGNLVTLVKEMRSDRDEEIAILQAARNNLGTETETPLPSIKAMLAAERFKTRTPHLSPEQQKEAARNLERKILEDAEIKGITEEEARSQIEERIAVRPYDIEFKAIDEGPFFIPKRLGAQKIIIINTSHPFYRKVYNEATMNRSAWEVLLFVLADGEIDAAGDRANFYKAERMCWSEMLRHALDHLVEDHVSVDQIASRIEATEAARNMNG